MLKLCVLVAGFLLVVVPLLALAKKEREMLVDKLPEGELPENRVLGLRDDVRNDPRSYTKWAALCYHMKGREYELPTTLAKGNLAKMDQRACYARTIEVGVQTNNEKSIAASYYNLANLVLGAGETVRIAGLGQAPLSRKDLLVKAAEFGASGPNAFYNLAIILNGEDTAEEAKAPHKVTVKGVQYDRLEAFVKCLDLSAQEGSTYLPQAWSNTAAALLNDKLQRRHVVVDGQVFTAKAAIAQELEGNPTGTVGGSGVWYNAALILENEMNKLSSSSSRKLVAITVDGKKYSKQACLIRQLEIDNNHAQAWFSLGATLRDGTDTVSVRGVGRQISAKTCFVRALELGGLSRPAAAYFALGTALTGNETVSLKLDKDTKPQKYSAQKLLLKAIAAEPKWADPYNNLAATLKDGNTIIGIPPDDEEFSRCGLFMRAINLAPDNSATWKNLCLMCYDPKDEHMRIEVDGGHYTKKMCDETAAELEAAENEKSREKFTTRKINA
jgi:hypothetical protein